MMHILIIGGGAAGLLAAITAASAQAGAVVTLLERNDRPGRKLLITGKGRCNVTADTDAAGCAAQCVRGGKFLRSALTRFPPAATMELLRRLGVPLSVERGGRVFPTSGRAADVVDALVAHARACGVQFVQGRAVSLLMEEAHSESLHHATINLKCVGVCTEDGREWRADAVIVCTGGQSYLATGSTGDGYALAAQAGHTVVPPRPSLVPLVTREHTPARLQGITLKNVALTAEDVTLGGKAAVVYSGFGELLFTHFGLSGPLALSASAHLVQPEPGRYRLCLDLKPALSAEVLDARLRRELEAASIRDVHIMLAALAPRAMGAVLAQAAQIPPSRKCAEVTREERQRLCATLKRLCFALEALRPFEEAVVTAGGVALDEVDARTMASRRLPGLFFAGEVLDADAYTGGYNLQIAFATGAAAGRGAVEQDA